MNRFLTLFCLTVFPLGLPNAVSAISDGDGSDDWPKFRGYKGDGISAETGLLKEWPEGGPREIWRIPIGEGYSGMAVVSGRLYTMDARDDSEFLICYDIRNGEEIWRTKVGPIYHDDQGNGPRATPTVDGDVVYSISGDGYLMAADRETGKTIWGIHVKKEFSFKDPPFWWGFSGAPVIEGDLLLLEAGGEGENSIVALNKKTAEPVWSTHSDLIGYSTPLAVDFDGKRQYVFVTSQHVVSVSPAGEIFWKASWGGNIIKIAMPVFVPPDMIFVSASYDIGAVLLKMTTTGHSIAVKEVWKSKVMRNHFNSSVLVGDHLYGFDNATLKCIDPRTGEQLWAKRRLGGKGSLIFADDHFFVLGERGLLLLVEADPTRYIEKSRVQILNGKTWTSPTLSAGRLYLRNQKEMVCLDVSGKDQG
ncbi:PQQ-like beta-propeller repeat protein [bacterium]|nr:PQQ-like beta-propeller repeat protein [bacterium]